MRDSWAILPVDLGLDSSAIRGRDISALNRRRSEARFRHAFQFPSVIGQPETWAVQQGAATHCVISAGFAAKSWCWDDKIGAPAKFDRSLSHAHDRGAADRYLVARRNAARARQDAPAVRLRRERRRTGQRRLADACEPASRIFLA